MVTLKTSRRSSVSLSGSGTVTRRGKPPNWWGILVFAVSLLVAQAGFAADTARVVAPERLAEFRSTYVIKSLRMNKYGSPETVEGTLSAGIKSGSAFNEVLTFLEHNKDLFRMVDPRSEWKLLMDHIEARNGMRYLRMQQMFHGLEVCNIQMTASFSSTGGLQSIGSSYIPDIGLPWTPTVSEVEAKLVVTRAVSSPDTLDLSRCRLIVFPWEGRCHLAWQIVAYPGGEYVIDAQTGKIIERDASGVFPKMRVVEPESPPRRAPYVYPPAGSPNGPRSGPAGVPVDTIPPEPGSPPGTPSGVIYAPGDNGVQRDSLHGGHGWLPNPRNLPSPPPDTNPAKKPPPKQQAMQLEPSVLSQK